MMRTLDEANEILSNLPTDVYEYTKVAAEDFYRFGDRTKLAAAAKLSGLTEEEILAWW